MISAAHASSADVPTTTGVSNEQVRDGHAGGLASLPAATSPIAPAPAAVPTPPPIPATTVVVAPGDNLWELSAQHLAMTTGRTRVDVGDGEITPYWVAVCEQNRPTLASHDPNVVYAGELVTFPRVP